MKQLTLNGYTLGVVDVPEDAYDIFIGTGDTPFCERPDDDYLCIRFGGGGSNRALPPGQWSILGRLNEITDEQAAELVEEVQFQTASGKILYYNYEAPGNDFRDIVEAAFKKATESLQSFFRSHGITGNPLIIINDK